MAHGDALQVSLAALAPAMEDLAWQWAAWGLAAVSLVAPLLTEVVGVLLAGLAPALQGWGWAGTRQLGF